MKNRILKGLLMGSMIFAMSDGYAGGDGINFLDEFINSASGDSSTGTLGGSNTQNANGQSGQSLVPSDATSGQSGQHLVPGDVPSGRDTDTVVFSYEAATDGGKNILSTLESFGGRIYSLKNEVKRQKFADDFVKGCKSIETQLQQIEEAIVEAEKSAQSLNSGIDADTLKGVLTVFSNACQNWGHDIKEGKAIFQVDEDQYDLGSLCMEKEAERNKYIDIMTEEMKITTLGELSKESKELLESVEAKRKEFLEGAFKDFGFNSVAYDEKSTIGENENLIKNTIRRFSESFKKSAKLGVDGLKDTCWKEAVNKALEDKGISIKLDDKAEKELDAKFKTSSGKVDNEYSDALSTEIGKVLNTALDQYASKNSENQIKEVMGEVHKATGEVINSKTDVKKAIEDAMLREVAKTVVDKDGELKKAVADKEEELKLEQEKIKGVSKMFGDRLNNLPLENKSIAFDKDKVSGSVEDLINLEKIALWKGMLMSKNGGLNFTVAISLDEIGRAHV